MREIKFRGKRVDYGEWVYGYLVGDNAIVGNLIEFNDEYFNTSFWCKVRPETVSQDTGLRDKNGKEIYEGDIVKGKTYLNKEEVFSRFIGEVKYRAPKFELEGVNKYKLCREELNSSYEVIGNIYENADLLKA